MRLSVSCSSLALALLWFVSCGRVEEMPSATDGGTAMDGPPSSDVSPSGDAAASDAREAWDVSPASDVAAAGAREACRRYAAATLALGTHYSAPRCGGPLVPAEEAARLTQRFEQACLNQAALLGSGMMPAALEACAAALEVSSCQLPGGPPLACEFRGSLPGGATCNEDIQCQSGWCEGTVFTPPGGPVDPYTCGTCAPVATLGEVCGSAVCESNAICMPSDPTAPSPTYTCVAVTEGELDASCDSLSKPCKPGLYCDGNTSQCAELGSVGAACGEGPSARWYGGCEPPLTCSGSPRTCLELLPAGAPCDPNADACASGLFCFATTSECTAVTWAGPAERCSEVTRCLVGSCITTEYIGGIASGTCPLIIPDGEPCDVPDRNATCDVLAECFQGTCQLPGGLVCN